MERGSLVGAAPILVAHLFELFYTVSVPIELGAVMAESVERRFVFRRVRGSALFWCLAKVVVRLLTSVVLTFYIAVCQNRI
jgi:hypothetical protein